MSAGKEVFKKHPGFISASWLVWESQLLEDCSGFSCLLLARFESLLYNKHFIKHQTDEFQHDLQMSTWEWSAHFQVWASQWEPDPSWFSQGQLDWCSAISESEWPKILSLATRYKGHIGNGLSGSPWKIPDLAISVCSQSVLLGGAWSFCRHQQGILLSRKTEGKQILYRAHSISYCHLIIYFTFKKGFRITFKNWKLRIKT